MPVCAVKGVGEPMFPRWHPCPGQAGYRRGPRTSPRLERWPATAERPEVPAADRMASRRATAGAMVKRSDGLFAQLKSAREASVRKENSPRRGCRLSAAGLSLPAACTRHGCAAFQSRNEQRSARPGVKLATYSTKGPISQHGNLDVSAMHAKHGKPSSPATSHARGRASIVVRARESRARGEGRQSCV